MKIRTRVIWFICLVFLIILLASSLIEAISYTQQMAEYREIYAGSEQQITQSILIILQADIQADNWTHVDQEISQIRDSNRDMRISLVKRDATILSDSYPGKDAWAIDSRLVDAAIQNGETSQWDAGKDTLQVATAIPISNERGAAVLVRMVNLQAPFNQVRRSALLNFALVTLVSFLAAGVVFFFIGRLVVHPLEQVRGIATAALSGDGSKRMAQTAIVELNGLADSFNQLLDHQEALRSGLEKALAARDGELQKANLELSQRASGLETLNAIIHAVSSSDNLQELVETALKQIVSFTHAQNGWLRIGQASAAHNIPDGMTTAIGRVVRNYPVEGNEKVSVPDWNDPALSGMLQELAQVVTPLGIRSSVNLPIRNRGVTVGRLDLSSKEPAFWGAQEVLLEIITQQLGEAGERLQVYQESIEHNRVMERLLRQGEMLNRSYTLEEIIQTIGNGALELNETRRGAFFLTDGPDGFVCPWQQGVSRRFIRAVISDTQVSSGFALPSGGASLIVGDINNLPDEMCEWWKDNGEGIQAYGIWPLVFEGRSSAYVACFYDQPFRLSRTQQEAMDSFTRQAAASLANAHLYEAEREQGDLAEALRNVASTLTSTLDLNEVIERILDNLSKVVDHDAANVMMLEGDILNMVRSHGFTLTGKPHQDWRQPIEKMKILEYVQENNHAIVISDTSLDVRWVPLPESSWIKSFASAPVCSRGKVIGFVNVSSGETGYFKKRHEVILQAFADQASIAIENARMYEATRQRMAETGTLYRAITPLLTAEGELQTVARSIVQAVVREFGVAHSSLLRLDREKRRLYQICEDGSARLGNPSISLDGLGLTVLAAKSRDVVYSQDVTTDTRYLNLIAETRSEVAIPLVVRNEVIGVLNLESFQADSFDDQTQRMLVTFAERAAWVLDNALLFDEARDSARRMTLLNEITQSSLAGGDLLTALRYIVQKVAELMDADGCYLTRWDEKNQFTIPLVAWGPDAEDYALTTPFTDEPTLTRSVMRLGKSIAVEDVFESPYIDAQVARMYLMRSVLGVPLIANGEKVGGILIGFTDTHSFTRQEIALAEQVGGQVALVFVLMNSLEVARVRAEESEKLRKATAALAMSLDVQEVADLIISQLGTLMQFDSAIVYLREEENLRPVAFMNIPPGAAILEMSLPVADSMLIEAQYTGLPVFLLDAQQEPQFRNFGGTHAMHSYLGIPLMVGNHMLGSISLGRFEVRSYTPDEILQARVFANQAVVALQNALLHAREQQLAITDPLTGLYNRRGFFELARHEMDRSRRFNRPLAVMMIDIDHFKGVNDQFGHATGDLVLKELGLCYHETMREADLICRYGGEEFCILLPESDQEGARVAAERLLAAIRSKVFTSDDHAVKITVSIGVTTGAECSKPLDQLIDEADKALMKAKEEGRDRVSYWG